MSDSTTGGLVALGLLALAIYSCSERPAKVASATQTPSAFVGSGSTREFGSPTGDYSDDTSADRREFDEDQAREDAEQDLADSTYQDEGSTYGCTDDCSGHEAGWKWRAEHGYPGYNADSPSFEEGSRAFDDAVEEKVEEKRQQYENDESDE